ncbi:MAG: hypothetical protein ACXWDJ_09690 [Aeromicrobium sp.]
MLSVNSLTGQLGGAIGLGLLADATSLTVSILTGAALLAVAAPLYVIARQPLHPLIRPVAVTGGNTKRASDLR